MLIKMLSFLALNIFSPTLIFSYMYQVKSHRHRQKLSHLLTFDPKRTNSSERLASTDQPFIENILEKYANIQDLTVLALGSSYWKPPQHALNSLNLHEVSIQKYGAILGIDELRINILNRWKRDGLDISDLDAVVACGANQAFYNVALTLCDDKRPSIMLAPYYFCHKASLQLVGSYIIDCPFNSENFMPDWSKLEEIIKRMRPVMIVITTPCNPSGAAWTLPDYHKLVELSRNTNTWLIFDQTYAEFLFDKSQHIIPCSKLLEYENIIHISSFSKNFGMPGWRVGYTIAPKSLTDSFRKIQDTIPTCAPIISQKLALACLAVDNANRVTTGKSWVQNRIESLQSVREAMWEVVQPLGTIRTTGAFYFLIPVPPQISEEEAVDILAHQYKILLMPGSAFGAPGYMRISYGSLEPSKSIAAITRLKDGLGYLLNLSSQRTSSTVD